MTGSSRHRSSAAHDVVAHHGCFSGQALHPGSVFAGVDRGRNGRRSGARSLDSRSRRALSAVEVDGISLPIAVGLLVMMYPVLAKVRYDQLGEVTADRRLMVSSLVLNWLVGPAVMFTLAWLAAMCVGAKLFVSALEMAAASLRYLVTTLGTRPPRWSRVSRPASPVSLGQWDWSFRSLLFLPLVGQCSVNVSEQITRRGRGLGLGQAQRIGPNCLYLVAYPH